MFRLGLSRLRLIGVGETIADRYVEPLAEAMAQWKIDTRFRAAAFIGQCVVESAGFTRVDEGLNYKTAKRIFEIFGPGGRVKSIEEAATLVGNPIALANTVYANRGGNGDFASGDGHRFHGRGPIQTTFRNNYAASGEANGKPYLENPGLLKEPVDGCLASAFYFASNGGNAFADEFEKGAGLTDAKIDRVTRMVNKGMLEKEQRRVLTKKALAVFST